MRDSFFDALERQVLALECAGSSRRDSAAINLRLQQRCVRGLLFRSHNAVYPGTQPPLFVHTKLPKQGLACCKNILMIGSNLDPHCQSLVLCSSPEEPDLFDNQTAQIVAYPDNQTALILVSPTCDIAQKIFGMAEDAVLAGVLAELCNRRVIAPLLDLENHPCDSAEFNTNSDDTRVSDLDPSRSPGQQTLPLVQVANASPRKPWTNTMLEGSARPSFVQPHHR